MFDHSAEREIRRDEDEIQKMNMRKKFIYEKPILAGLNGAMTCNGASCSYGDGTYNSDPMMGLPCSAGSCVDWSYCHSGFKAESCCSGSNACESSASSCTACVTGSGVSGFVQTGQCYCSYGAGACADCASGGSATGCGTGSTPVF